jgi:hypothetical protein
MTCRCRQVYSRLVQMMRGQRRILDCANLDSLIGFSSKCYMCSPEVLMDQHLEQCSGLICGSAHPFRLSAVPSRWFLHDKS